MSRNYYNKSMCALCGGKCCTKMAGSYIPEDFKEKITADFIVSLLLTGKFAIDWWEASPVIYYLRPRHVQEEAVRGSWGGICVNWKQETGCSLEKSDRPYGCRKLIPNLVNGEPNCDYDKKDKAQKQDIAERWIPYQDILEEAKDKYFQMEEDGELISNE